MKKNANGILEQMSSKFEKLLGMVLPVLGEVIFILGWPIVVLVCASLAQKLLPADFWVRIIVFFSMVSLVLCIVNRDGIWFRDIRKKLRNLLIVFSGGFEFVILANNQNLDLNNLSLVLYAIGACLFVAGIVVMVLNFMGMNHVNLDDCYSGFSALISIFVIIISLGETWIHFGNQFIWMPIFASMVYFFFNGNNLNGNVKFDKKGISLYAIFTFLLIGIISTFYQFWHTEIVSGLSMSYIFLGMMIIFVMIIIVKFAYNIQKKIIVKNEKKTEEKRKEIEIKEIVEIILSGNVMWGNILRLSELCSDVTVRSKFSAIVSKIHLAPLNQLVQVCKNKEQIVWGGNDFKNALAILEKIAEKTYDDEIIDRLKKQLNDFLVLMEAHSKYDGYYRMRKEIEEYYPTIIRLIQN